MELPDFDDLTLDPSGPIANTWGLFGADDELGLLNLLTPDVVAAAAQEIRTGKRIALDHPLDFPANPSFGRQRFRHEVKPSDPDFPSNDDVVEFNTQSSTQWDGLKHFGELTKGRFYGGRETKVLKGSKMLGIDAWLRNGGIQGRGVLIDWATWAAEKGVKVDPFSAMSIPLADVKQIVKDRNIKIRRGDILLIHSGLGKALKALSPDEEKAVAERASPEYIGLEPGEETARWIWSCHFAAVAGDTIGFERMPPAMEDVKSGYFLHQCLLAGWGMPIGELFNLEALVEHCRETGRYTFLFSSVPLNLPGGAASPPNAVAIF